MNENDLENKSVPELQKLIDETETLLVVKQQSMRKEVLAKINELATSIGVIAEIHDNNSIKQLSAVAARYQNPENHLQTWTGRGLTPKWLKALIANGHSKDEFLIQR